MMKHVLHNSERRCADYTLSTIAIKNVASIGFVLQIMRFDMVHTLVNRYGMPDFAQFVQMETKGIKHFVAVCIESHYL